MAYIGRGLDNGVRNQFIFAATQGQTAFTGADSGGKTLAMTDILYTDCYQNGVKLKPTTDYTVSLTTLTLISAASLNDVVDIVAFDIFGVPDTVPASTGGTFGGGITATTGTFSGALSANSYGAISGTTGTFSGAISGTTGTFSNVLTSQQDSNGLLNLYRTYATTTSLMGSINSGNTDFDSALAGIDFYQDGSKTAGRMDFITQPNAGAKTTRMSLTSGGTLEFNSQGASQITLRSTASGSHIYTAFSFRNSSSSDVGNIAVGTSSTAYNTSSDYRLKENVDYDWDATTRLKQLKPARFNFIADDTNTLVDGFLAHEVSSVVPEAISGAKDAMAVETRYTADDVETQGDDPSKNVGDPKTYSSSKIDSQGIDQSKLVPLLIKTIQELEARITALEA